MRIILPISDSPDYLTTDTEPPASQIVEVGGWARIALTCHFRDADGATLTAGNYGAAVNLLHKRAGMPLSTSGFFNLTDRTPFIFGSQVPPGGLFLKLSTFTPPPAATSIVIEIDQLPT